MVKIYKLTDPNTNEVKYVGKTTNELHLRLAMHISSVFRSRRFSSFQDWISSLLKENKIPICELLEEVEEQLSSEREKFFIQHYHKEGSPLINIVFLYNKEYFDFRSQVRSKKIYQYDIEGNFIKEWKSLLDAANFYNVESGNIAYSASGKRKMCGGYQWRYWKKETICKYVKDIHRKPVYKYTLSGEYLCDYTAVSLVENIKPKLISKCCNGLLKSVYGFRYSFDKLDKLDPIRRKQNKNKGIKKIKDIVQSL